MTKVDLSFPNRNLKMRWSGFVASTPSDSPEDIPTVRADQNHANHPKRTDRVRRSDPLPAQLHLAVSQLQRVWMEGGRLTVEEILAESPQLQSSTEALVELCLTEYRARQAAGDRVREADYLLRFPYLRPHLQARFRDEPAAASPRRPSAQPAQQPQQQPRQQPQQQPARLTLYNPSPAATPGVDSYLDQSPAHTLDAPRSMPDAPRRPPVAPVFQTQDYRTSQYPFLQPPQESDEIGRVNDFGILRELGRGNMGIVFLAREPGKLRRQIALKIMLPTLAENEGCCRRFEREARNMARLNHERTIPVYHVDEYRDPTSGNRIPFLTMPILRGMTLKERLSRGAIPIAEVVRIAREIAEGLATAHAEGIVHRDIKPANIWLQADTQSVKILDFRPGPRPRRRKPHRLRGWRGRRHPRLHGPRTAQPPTRRHRPPHRPVRAGRHPLRDAHRPTALPWPDYPRDCPGTDQSQPATRAQAQPRRAQSAGRVGPPTASQGEAGSAAIGQRGGQAARRD
jgi:hypothetical protein